MRDTVVRRLASYIDARLRCGGNANQEWFDRHTQAILRLVEHHLPGGSGIDCGTKVDLRRSTPEKIVLSCSFHHMNEHGMYDGWTEHLVVVRASLVHGLDVRVTGLNRNNTKDYLREVFDLALRAELPEECGAGPEASP